MFAVEISTLERLIDQPKSNSTNLSANTQPTWTLTATTHRKLQSNYDLTRLHHRVGTDRKQVDIRGL